MEVQEDCIEDRSTPEYQESQQEQPAAENDTAYTTNFIQGPPPLISDSTRTHQTRRQLVSSGHTKPTSTVPKTVERFSDIPGVYFGYQLQEEQLAAQETSYRADPQPSPVREQAETEMDDSIAVNEPPPLISSHKTPEVHVDSTLKEQIARNTSKLISFIQSRVLNSINGSASSILPPNSNTCYDTDNHTRTSTITVDLNQYSSIHDDGFRPVPPVVVTQDSRLTGAEQKSLSSYKQNYLRDLQVQSATTTTQYIVPNTNTLSNTPSNYTTATQVPIQATSPTAYGVRRKRQKKTREEKLAYLRQYARDRRARETPEQREARLADLRARQRARKANETPEQRRLRLEKDRLKTGRYRAKRKMDDNGRIVLDPNNGAQGPYVSLSVN